jgi:class 3 adenylate cyclase
MRPDGNDLRLRLARRSRPSLYSDGKELSVPVDRVERKLAAIFAADIAGYSRLMARDEVGTLARLRLAAPSSMS